jgi:hypothetical protein
MNNRDGYHPITGTKVDCGELRRRGECSLIQTSNVAAMAHQISLESAVSHITVALQMKQMLLPRPTFE